LADECRRTRSPFGNFPEARQYAAAGLKLAAAGQGVQVEAALAYAMAGGTTHAAMLATELHKRYPLDTQMQSLWLPAIQAQSALDNKNPAAAFAALQATVPPAEYGFRLCRDQLMPLPNLNSWSGLSHGWTSRNIFGVGEYYSTRGVVHIAGTKTIGKRIPLDNKNLRCGDNFERTLVAGGA
jgi:hypothetical protein